MLGLKLETDPLWVKNTVEGNLQEILTDHAWCEQKATTQAISLMVSFPELTDLVQTMTELSQEEMSHFGMVHAKIVERGWTLGRQRKDDYVNELIKFTRKGGSREQNLLDKLLLSAMIEARSCERCRSSFRARPGLVLPRPDGF
jgi:tRNA-(ms[2]io[6]A)-hydroxylase